MTVLARVYSGVYQKTFYNRVLCKGAPEVIIPKCKFYFENDGVMLKDVCKEIKGKKYCFKENG